MCNEACSYYTGLLKRKKFSVLDMSPCGSKVLPGYVMIDSETKAEKSHMGISKFWIQDQVNRVK